MPTITFEVNLEPQDLMSANLPDSSSTHSRNTRSTFFPDLHNFNRILKHGDQFTLEGASAIYMKTNYVGNLLKIISET